MQFNLSEALQKLEYLSTILLEVKLKEMSWCLYNKTSILFHSITFVKAGSM